MANWEQLGRARKVTAPVAAIDRAAINQGLSPFDHAGRVQLATMTWTDDHWAALARIASDMTGRNINPPSTESRKAVREVYIERAKAKPMERES